MRQIVMTADQICATPSRRNLRLKWRGVFRQLSQLRQVTDSAQPPCGDGGQHLRVVPTVRFTIIFPLSIVAKTLSLTYIFKGSAGHLVVKDRLRYRIPYSSTHSRLYRLLACIACMLYTQISVAAVSHAVNLKQIRPDHTVNSVEVGPPVRHP